MVEALERHPDAVQRRTVPAEHRFDGAGGFLYASAAQRRLRPRLRVRASRFFLRKISAGAATGMELQEEAAVLAQENAVQNSLSDRLRILCGDLREHRTLLPAQQLRRRRLQSALLSAGSAASPIPRRWLRRGRSFSAHWTISAPARRGCLEAEGVFVVHKPERLAELICALSRRRLEPSACVWCAIRPEAPFPSFFWKRGWTAVRGCNLTRTFVFTTQAEPKARISAESIIIRRLDMAGTLYLVPADRQSGRYLPACEKTLAEADFIAAEDTRVSLKLLNHLELKKAARQLL